MSSAESEALASGILKALGGKNNIVKVDYCATRLRFEVHSYASVDEAAAKAAGAEGVIRPAKNACQVVIKGDVQAVYDALRKQQLRSRFLTQTASRTPPGTGRCARPGGIFIGKEF